LNFLEFDDVGHGIVEFCLVLLLDGLDVGFLDGQCFFK
jgi:hypothetical protein